MDRIGDLAAAEFAGHKARAMEYWVCEKQEKPACKTADPVVSDGLFATPDGNVHVVSCPECNHVSLHPTTMQKKPAQEAEASDDAEAEE